MVSGREGQTMVDSNKDISHVHSRISLRVSIWASSSIAYILCGKINEPETQKRLPYDHYSSSRAQQSVRTFFQQVENLSQKHLGNKQVTNLVHQP